MSRPPALSIPRACAVGLTTLTLSICRGPIFTLRPLPGSTAACGARRRHGTRVLCRARTHRRQTSRSRSRRAKSSSTLTCCPRSTTTRAWAGPRPTMQTAQWTTSRGLRSGGTRQSRTCRRPTRRQAPRISCNSGPRCPRRSTLAPPRFRPPCPTTLRQKTSGASGMSRGAASARRRGRKGRAQARRRRRTARRFARRRGAARAQKCRRATRAICLTCAARRPTSARALPAPIQWRLSFPR